MIIGIGMDIIELDRIASMLERQPKFLLRVLTEKERTRAGQLSGHRQVEYVAGRFAAKEAYAKALGTGIGKELSFLDLEVTPDERGKPVMRGPAPYLTHVSITHSRQFAAAQVILESPSS
ncbi:holo-ACP synthase [Ectobacillus ponti]|uniref:Holo-[acyl-carrier-protein] synthase n=1 Tax=Ectobacillus ponti TaxID=2961894 RepID=A0AA41XFN4_9BACI|nr:holo-ACP synthase [Ectobacillus ponti]